MGYLYHLNAVERLWGRHLANPRRPGVDRVNKFAPVANRLHSHWTTARVSRLLFHTVRAVALWRSLWITRHTEQQPEVVVMGYGGLEGHEMTGLFTSSKRASYHTDIWSGIAIQSVAIKTSLLNTNNWTHVQPVFDLSLDLDLKSYMVLKVFMGFISLIKESF